MRNEVSYLVYMYTLGAGRILIKSIIIVCFLAHLSRRLNGELIVYRSIRRPCVSASVRLCVNIFKLEYLRNQWANRNQIYLKHHWVGGLIALGFGPGRIGTLVSMATNSSHRVIMWKMLCPL